MNHEGWRWALFEYLAGRADEVQSLRIESRLREDTAFRDLYLDMINVEIGLRQSAEVVWMERQGMRCELHPSKGAPMRRRWVGIAAGMVIGLLAGVLLSASVGWAFQVTKTPGRGESIALGNGDFEGGLALLADGVPRSSGAWGGDFAEVVGMDGGVVPHGGKRMLKFLRADNRLTPIGSRPAVAEMWQVIDLSSGAHAIGDVSRQIEAVIRFDAAAVSGDRVTFGVSLHAFAGAVSEAPELWRDHNALAIASASREELADEHPNVWQTLRVRMALPREAKVLLVGVRASRKGSHLERAEFGAHYVDDVEVFFADHPQPITPSP